MASDEMDVASAIKISETLMRSERWEAAVAFLEGHAELVKGDFSLSWTLGWAHCKQGQFGEARRVMLQAIPLAQSARHECIGHWTLGHSYRGLGQYDQAETSLSESLRIDDLFPARLELALLLMERGRSAEAEQVHLEGIRVKPKSRERWEAYASFLSDAGRETEAQGALAKAHSVPGDSTVR